jgi:CheY-like chemotaxis protein
MQVETAAAGEEALGVLKAAAEAGRPYHAALLDVQMPEMDGWTLARAIQTDPALDGTRLIVLTSVGQAFDPAELKAAGIEAYLVKPVKQSRLFDCLASAMGKAVAETPVHQIAPSSHSAVTIPVSYWAGDPIWSPENWASGRSFSPLIGVGKNVDNISDTNHRNKIGQTPLKKLAAPKDICCRPRFLVSPIILRSLVDHRILCQVFHRHTTYWVDGAKYLPYPRAHCGI